MSKSSPSTTGPPTEALTPAIASAWRRIAAVLSAAHLGPAAYSSRVPVGSSPLDAVPATAFVGIALSCNRRVTVDEADPENSVGRLGEIVMELSDAAVFFDSAPLNLASLRASDTQDFGAIAAALRNNPCHAHMTALRLAGGVNEAAAAQLIAAPGPG